MSLTIQTEVDDQQQMAMTIEVDEDRVQEAMKKKARELGREIAVPGFRRGKAPLDAVVRRIGEATLRSETIEDLIQPVFEEALNQADVVPFARASLDDIDPQPLVLRFTVPLVPLVSLGDYREKRKDVVPIEITDEAVQEALEYTRTRHQNIESVERAAAVGDVLSIGGIGRLVPAEGDEATADETIFNEESIDVLLDSETLFISTSFVDELVGMSAGDEKSFTITFPDEYEPMVDFAGRSAAFTLTVLDVKNRELPPLDDELAKLEGDYETLDDLRAVITEDLRLQAEENAREDLVEEMTNGLVDEATIVFPPAAVDAQIDDMVGDFKHRLEHSGWRFQDYLQLQGLTEDAMREEFRESAETQLRRQLVVRQFILDEKLRITAEDIDRQIEERVANFEKESLKDSMRQYFRSEQGFDAISSTILRDKVYERWVAILSGNAPDLAELEAQEDAAADEEE